MDPHRDPIQTPPPGRRLVRFRGDLQTFTLEVGCRRGTAWIRTNIGHAAVARDEIVRQVHDDQPPPGRDWFDLSMRAVDDRRFCITLPLCEVGHFEAKCFFLPSHGDDPQWPRGPNVVLNVSAGDTCCANTIYNAFVRQFGANKGSATHADPSREACIRMLDQDGYAVIPPSGTFRDVIAHLDFIIGDLGCRFLMLLPIQPTPTVYGRMGRFGSPYASLSFTAVDPALAQFDPRATPLEQFVELIDAVHRRHAKLLIDIAVNHTGWAAALHETHPQWLVRNPDGQIEVPGAWGVRWEDLTRLDYGRRDLWQHVAEVFLTWCRRGVDGFRCDAGYMIPVAAWRYIVASVRRQFPDTVFLLEGLGGPLKATRDILNRANFDWCYSELFQNYDRGQIESYLPQALDIARSDGIAVHFAETHDNDRLADRSETYARMRTALCALCSTHGAFAFANGVEWLATAKIDVHGAPSLNWGAADNQVAQIGRLNRLIEAHPAFRDQADVALVPVGSGQFVALLRQHPPSGRRLLILANLDCDQPTVARWDARVLDNSPSRWIDLLSGDAIEIAASNGVPELSLAPGRVLCLSPRADDLALIEQHRDAAYRLPARIRHQLLRAKAMEIFQFHHGRGDSGDWNPDDAARRLARDPQAACRPDGPDTDEPRTIPWRWPGDLKREVMLPPGHFLVVCADHPFRVRLSEGDRTLASEVGLACDDDTFTAVIVPPPVPSVHRRLTLRLVVYEPSETVHRDAPLLLLAQAASLRVRQVFSATDLARRSLMLLGTNGRGAMMRVHAAWNGLHSRYDALLAANLDPDMPQDRRVMLARCRAWIVYQGYSQAVDFDLLETFVCSQKSRGTWCYCIPAGQGQHVIVSITAAMLAGANAVTLSFFRHGAREETDCLKDDAAVRLILRPDIEDRNFHDTTKAYQGPETQFPALVGPMADGFSFGRPGAHRLIMRLSGGTFTLQPEWQYRVRRPLEEQRGLDPESDLFSPGFFSALLEGGQTLTLRAEALLQDSAPSDFLSSEKGPPLAPSEVSGNAPPLEILEQALDHYTVVRGPHRSVIAGYPWFLDWGRDALIFARGLIATGRLEVARSIITLFAEFESGGSLPNMIRGADTANRDTADAPLWLAVACSDLAAAGSSQDLLAQPCGSRSLKEVLISIGRSLMAGTPHGVRMDPASGLLYSPGHFTWMDTNHPAGTPREGYAVEIQALWYATLAFLDRIDGQRREAPWKHTADQVRHSLLKLFVVEPEGFLCDCRHAAAGVPAREAEPDDFLRPNQLLAVTLGAVTARQRMGRVVEACRELLVPGAVRSLADRPVRRPLPITHDDRLLNDPTHPYQGHYLGDEDTRRKPAYHNGTAWTWLLPVFCEAWFCAYGPSGRETALSWLSSSIALLEQGCAGHLPEIRDGDAPHLARGCDAQAWSASELLRVWMKLTGGYCKVSKNSLY